MLKFTFFHPLGYLGLVAATQRIPLLQAQCWDGQRGFTVDLVMN